MQKLMESFQASPFLEKAEKCKLAKSLNISAKKVEEWFKYRRKKMKEKELLLESESLLKNAKSMYNDCL